VSSRSVCETWVFERQFEKREHEGVNASNMN
jgi:hypothetical protein